MMNDLLIFLIILSVIVVISKLFNNHVCDHAEQVYYDAAGDELSENQNEACFCKCTKCGRVAVIPSGFQSNAHFENYLHQCEQGYSQALKKIKDN
jgi:hypothetical protein